MKGLLQERERGLNALNDHNIIQLYIDRSERAITETGAKYGAYCFSIASSILANREDAEECVNDTYLAAWNAIPPHRPVRLATFLGRITRNISINCLKARNTQKRGSGEWAVALDELEAFADGKQDVEAALTYQEMVASFNRFLSTLPKTDRDIFLRRYWFVEPVSDIADSFGFTQSKVASMLFRTRKKLHRHFEKENVL